VGVTLSVRAVCMCEQRWFGQWAWPGSSRGGLGPLRAGARYSSIGPGPDKTFPISRDFPIDSNALISKIENLTLPDFKNFQNLHGGRKLKGNIFTFEKKFKFPTKFELKI
jgi:hypothetical protein